MCLALLSKCLSLFKVGRGEEPLQMRTRAQEFAGRALACYMTLGKSLTLCGLFSYLTQRGGEQVR